MRVDRAIPWSDMDEILALHRNTSISKIADKMCVSVATISSVLNADIFAINKDVDGLLAIRSRNIAEWAAKRHGVKLPPANHTATTPDLISRVIKMTDHMSGTEIADTVGTSVAKIYKIQRAYRAAAAGNMEELKRLYWRNGVITRIVAERFGISLDDIRPEREEKPDEPPPAEEEPGVSAKVMETLDEVKAALRQLVERVDGMDGVCRNAVDKDCLNANMDMLLAAMRRM